MNRLQTHLDRGSAWLDRGSAWLDEVAADLLSWRDALRPPRYLRFIEQEDGAFRLEASVALSPAAPASTPFASLPRKILPKFLPKILRAQAIASKAPPPPAGPFRLREGLSAEERAALAPALALARVEIVLRPDHFLFRPLTLPRRATDFLAGIVRAQIDRLTPWSAGEAAFGFLSAAGPADAPMSVTVAATAQSRLTPFVEAVGGLGVETVIISTIAPEAGNARIAVLEREIKGAVDARRLSRSLAIGLAGLGAVCAVSIALLVILGGSLQSSADALNGQIAQKRAALHRTGDAASMAALALAQRKHEQPSSVLVYEELSEVIPDDTYLTEIRIEGDKLQIAGVSQEAPELIRRLERSPHFTQAAFFAPTTRSPSDPGQHFSIEAHIAPVFSVREAAAQ